MKFNAVVLAMLATSVSAADFSLRAAANKLLGTTESTAAHSTESRMIVQGLLHAASEEDLEIIGKSAIAAYNKVYGPYGHSIQAFKTSTSVTVSQIPGISDPSCGALCNPNDDAVATKGQTEIVFGRVSQIPGISDPSCGALCNPNDDATFVELNGAQLADVHKSFEDKFCAKLRSSGSANLANAKGCAFAILDVPGQADFVPIESAYASTNGQSTEGQIVLQGLLNDLSESDMKLIDESVMAAYDDAFAKVGFKLKLSSKTSVGVSQIPGISDPSCGALCNPNDDMTLGESQIVFSRVSQIPGISDPSCGALCNPNDDVIVVNLKETERAYMHKAFEKAFCAKLQNSGVANFANAHGCTFRFVYDPVGDAKTAQQ